MKNIGELTREQMIEQGYNNPGHDRYLCYFFDEEVSLGEFNVEKIIEFDKLRCSRCSRSSQEYAEGQPIYVTGKELMEFRK